MPELKWRTQAPFAQEQEDYVVFASQLPAAGLRAVPAFLRHTLRIARQLRGSPGLVAYSLRADLLSHRFWTLSAWRDEASLRAFVRTEPHSATMRALARYTKGARFASWPARYPLPLPSWEEVEHRLRVPPRAGPANRERREAGEATSS